METSTDGLTNRADGLEWVRFEEPRICAVTQDLLDWYWPRGVGHWIEEALERSVMHELHLDEVYAGCRDGTYLLLAIRLGDLLTGCAVVAASTDPVGRTYLALICCGGERVEEWLSLLVTTCKAIAAQFKAREIVVMGRPGWRFMLTPHGLRLRAVVMVLDLEESHDG